MTTDKAARLWVRLDAGYYNDDAIIRVGVLAEALFVRSIGWCRERMSDGLIRREQLSRLTAGFRGLATDEELVAALTSSTPTSHPLWTPCPEGWRVTSYLKWNHSAGTLAEIKEQRAGAAKARWAKERRTSEASHPHVAYVKDDQTEADLTDAERDTLEPAADWDEQVVMDHYRVERAAHGRGRHNELEVQRVMRQLHTSRAAADELGGQVSLADVKAIITNWLAWGRPLQPKNLFRVSPTHQAPWWLVCLRGQEQPRAAHKTRSPNGSTKDPADDVRPAPARLKDALK